MKPLIGITIDIITKDYTYYQQNTHYTEVLDQAGANPILISHNSDIDWLVNNLDGLLIPGGLDLIPQAYNETPHPLSHIQNPERFNFEKKLYQTLPQKLPVLGICYGCQFINVAHNGTLHQHLPDTLKHKEHQSHQIFEYKIIPNSKLHKIINKNTAQGETFHHQAVKTLGDQLLISAYAQDGTVEAIETTNERWVIGVQWHPERTSNHPDSIKLFHNFVKECSVYKSNKNVQNQ